MKKEILLLGLLSQLTTLIFSQNWTNYNQNNSGLSDNGVSTITVDNNDVVWIGASGCGFNYGLNRFDGSTWSNYVTTNSGLASDAVQRVIADSNNNVWISYAYCGNGLTKFDGTTWTTYNTSNSNIPSNIVMDLFIDSNNDLWLACNGLTKFTGTSFINYMYNPLVSAIYIKDSLAYATSENLGLYKFNISDSTTTHYTTSNSNIPSMNFGTLAIDQNGILWMGCQYNFPGSTGGIATFNGNNFTAINPFTNSGTWVYYNQSIAVDQLNNIWVSNRCEGLYKYDGVIWTQIGANMPQTGCAGFVYADHYNRIWYGEVSSGVWTNTPNVGITQLSASESVNLFPNPTNSIITIVLNNSRTIKVFNMLGKIEIEKNFTLIPNRKVELDVSFLSAGIYFIQVGNEVRKFVKE